MLSQRLFKFLSKLALFAICFASVAPSVSYALQVNSGAAFVQEVCSTNGEKITIKVLTTKGQQLATELPSQPSKNAAPINIQHHLNHCPFCANASADAAILTPHAAILHTLTAQAQQISAAQVVDLATFSPLPPPAQAPPSTR